MNVIAVETPHEPSRRFWRALWIGVLLCGCLYVGQRWSPSSYAIVLQQFGVTDTGVVAGLPRVERGDEFAWQTPLLLMTVRSGFGRYDKTAPYFEDLRSLYGMPIVDWAIVFKPQFWLFFVLPPSFAYSFYWFFLIALFVVGFTLLFIRLGGRAWHSLFMALTLFFSAYVQYWWDGTSNFFLPFFPWVVLSMFWPLPLLARLGIFYWCFVCGLLTYFYPPNAISLGFVAAILWATVRPDLLRWKPLAGLAAAAALAGGTVLYYLRDAIANLSQTVYPGQRISGGGGISVGSWLSQFFPTSQMNHHVPLVPAPNICELATIGSVYVLAMVLFIDWRALATTSSREERRRWMWLAAGLLATQAWMMIALPPWAGYPLLWHLVPPGRMVLSGGVMLMIVAFVLGQARPLVFSAARCVAFSAAVILAWSLFKHPHGISFTEGYRDWIFLVPVVAVGTAVWLGLLTAVRANGALLASAFLLGAISFGTYNPIQSTEPIFRKPTTPITAEFDRRLREDGKGFILEPWGKSFFSHSGLPLVALGYPSLSYATFDPAMDLWRKLYPELPADELRRTFQNVGTFAFGDVPAPKWMPIYTLAPIAPFMKPGLTVCDIIRPSRQQFAGLVGCPPSPASSGGVQ